MRRVAAIVGVAVWGAAWTACGAGDAAPEPAPVSAPAAFAPGAPGPVSAPASAAAATAREAPVVGEAEVASDGVRRVVISASGDLVLNALAMRSVRAHATEEEGYAALLAGYARSIAEGEIAYLNLEMPLVDDEVALDPGWPRSLPSQPRRAPVLGATPALARVLATIGVDVVGVANNHAYDQGHAGLRRTLAALDEAALVALGAAEREEDAYAARVIERDGVRVAWLALTVALNRGARDARPVHVARVRRSELARVRQAVAAARAQADVVVVAVHWSTDFVMEADGEQRALGAQLIEAGADVVLGTGPHVLHEVVRAESARGEALVAYSLGNLASGMGRAYRLGHPPRDYVHPANALPEARDGITLRIALRVERSGEIAIEAIEGVPLWTENELVDRPTDDRRVRVVPLAEAAPDVRAEREPVIRAALGDLVVFRPPPSAR